jgi:SPP1 gp7 family putative phage head morphogenesis protein
MAVRADILRIERPTRALHATQLHVVRFETDPAQPRTDDRIDFAAIKRTSEFIERAASRTLANLVARSVWGLLANPLDLVALLDQDVQDITDMRLPESAVNALQQACRQSLFMGWSLGVQQAQRETKRQRQFTRLKFADLRDKAAEYLDANGMRMAENVSDGVRAILQQELMRGVRVGMRPEAVVASIFDRLIDRGMIDPPAVRAAVDNESIIAQMLELDDPDAVPSYLNTLVRTNTFESMNEARFAEFTDPALGGYVQALEYSAILDENTTEFCRYMDGRVYAADNEVWDTHRPPNHYNCRSLLIPITQLSGWDGQESEPPDVDPATGFARCGCAVHAFEFNPNQPRDERGRWGEGGADKGEATPVDATAGIIAATAAPRGQYLPTGRVAPFAIDEDRRKEAESVVERGTPRRVTVEASELIATQPEVRLTRVKSMLENWDANADVPLVAEIGGKKYIVDGHHRAAALAWSGAQKMTVMLYAGGG